MTTKLEKALETVKRALANERIARTAHAEKKTARGKERVGRAHAAVLRARRALRAAEKEVAPSALRKAATSLATQVGATATVIDHEPGEARVALRKTIAPEEPLGDGEVRITVGSLRITTNDPAKAGAMIGQLLGALLPSAKLTPESEIVQRTLALTKGGSR